MMQCLSFHSASRVSDTPVQFHLDAGGCWLLLFGLLHGALRRRPKHNGLCQSRRGDTGWRGSRLLCLGTLGVFGLQDAMSFLIAWEVMSFGGAVMILGEGVSPISRRPHALHAGSA